MPSQRIDVQLKVPMDPRPIQQELESEGFEVTIYEVRGGPVFSAVDLVTFVVEHLDDAVLPVLASVVAKLIARSRRSVGERGVNFTVKDSEQMIIVNVTGDGNWVQLHPRPEPDEEE